MGVGVEKWYVSIKNLNNSSLTPNILHYLFCLQNLIQALPSKVRFLVKNRAKKGRTISDPPFAL